MTRALTGDTIVQKPANNIYTVLALVALVAQIMGLIAIFVRASTLQIPLF